MSVHIIEDKNEKKMKNKRKKGLLDRVTMVLKRITPQSRQQSVYECLVRCNPGNDPQILLDHYYSNKSKIILLTLIMGLIFSGLLFFMKYSEKEIVNNNEIFRDDYTGRDKTIVSTVKSDHYDDIKIQIPISKLHYSNDEVDENFIEAELWFLDQVLLNNDSFEHICYDLNFPDFYQDKQIFLDYTISNYELVSSTGKINNKNLTEEELVTVQVTYSYEQYSVEKAYDFHICPQILSNDELFIKNVSKSIEESDIAQREKNIFTLPTKIGNENISYKENMDHSYIYLFLLSIVGIILLSFGMDRDVFQSFQKRKDDLLFSYPEFVSKLALLIGAGMSVTSAMRRIHETLKVTEKGSCFTEELGIFMRNIDNGILVERALEELGERTSIPQYRKFCSILITNMKKGSINLKNVLNEEAEQSFILYQTQIRKKGEEASTKLLLPMVMMLGVVIAIILVPAFLTYQI